VLHLKYKKSMLSVTKVTYCYTWRDCVMSYLMLKVDILLRIFYYVSNTAKLPLKNITPLDYTAKKTT